MRVRDTSVARYRPFKCEVQHSETFTKKAHREKTEHGLSKFTKGIIQTASANNAQAAKAVQSTAPAPQPSLGSGSVILAAQDRPSLIQQSTPGEQKLEPS